MIFGLEFRMPTERRLRAVALNYAYNVGTWLSQGVNVLVLLGDPDESVSSRIGKSIRGHGWARRVPWPKAVLRHFLRSVEPDRGQDGALTRRRRY